MALKVKEMKAIDILINSMSRKHIENNQSLFVSKKHYTNLFKGSNRSLTRKRGKNGFHYNGCNIFLMN